MKRGDVVTVAAGGGFGGKPRPAVILQADAYDALDTIVLLLFTSTIGGTALRPHILPDAANGLDKPSDLMIDIPVTVRRDKIGQACGMLASGDLARMDRAVLVFLGLA